MPNRVFKPPTTPLQRGHGRRGRTGAAVKAALRLPSRQRRRQQEKVGDVPRGAELEVTPSVPFPCARGDTRRATAGCAGVLGAAGPPPFPQPQPWGGAGPAPGDSRAAAAVSAPPAGSTLAGLQPWTTAPSPSAKGWAHLAGYNLKKLGKGVQGRDFSGTDPRLLISPDAPEPAGKRGNKPLAGRTSPASRLLWAPVTCWRLCARPAGRPAPTFLRCVRLPPGVCRACYL